MFNDIPENLAKLLEDKSIVPEKNKVFRCFSYFQPKDTKVIIIGQDPYSDKNLACGLAFSTEGTKVPGSLKNIIKELNSDLKLKIKPKMGNLEKWAEQGVLLLNPVLTTRNGISKAHYNKGWQEYTRNKVQLILDLKQPVVIIAWGKFAQDFVSLLSLHDNNCVLTGAHPSPINSHGGFLKGKYFSRANKFLTSRGVSEINWKL